MKTFFLVKQEQADLARQMESRLMSLPLSTGILFAGVSIQLRDTGHGSVSPIYHVWVGCHRDFDEKLMDPLVRVTLKEEIAGGAFVEVEAHRGLSRSAIKSVDKST